MFFCFPCVFCFLKVYGWRKSPNTKKKQVFLCFLHFKTPKKQGKQKTSFATKPKSLFKVVFFFLGFWFRSFGVIIILYILQAFRCTKITNRVYIIYVCVLYVCMCVLKDMIQEALRWISGGVYYIYTSRQ